MFFKRNISEKLEKALKRSPVVLLTGARQTGKTTLMKQLLTKKGYSYLTFDDITNLSAAQDDPIEFISNIKKPAILDEVQRVPELFLTIKSYVDLHRTPGLFALTGSANPLLIPNLSDSLAGRMEILELFPFSQGELLNKRETFLESIFSNKLSDLRSLDLSKEDLCETLIKGGYPSVQSFDNEDIQAWFNAYLTTILQRDVKDLANIEGLTQLPNLLRLLSTRAGGLLNVSELSRSSGISGSTMRRYLTLLETLFLITLQSPWSTNLSKRLVKSAKIYLTDPGILLHLIRTNKERLAADTQLFGKALENFIVTELLKQASWSRLNVKTYHYRTQTGVEVDILLEDSSGQVFGIEVKGAQTVISNDFKGLKSLKETIGKKFIGGMVIYPGTQKVPFGKNLWAIPISCLWG